MNQPQKQLAKNLVFVILITIGFAFTLTNIKDVINRREAVMAMSQLGHKIMAYKKETGVLPNENVLKGMRVNIEGSARLGEITYRAPYISIGAEPNTILIYSPKNYRMLLVKSGCVVLFLNGNVEYIEKSKFEAMLKKQQSDIEIRDLQQGSRAKNSF